MKKTILNLKIEPFPVKKHCVFFMATGEGFLFLGDAMKLLTQERLKELLNYNPETGLFTRRKNIPGLKKGSVAGHVSARMYRRIRVDGKAYAASRLAWLYMEGYWPEHQMDHINRIKNDDRWKNLRHVSAQCNLRNCGVAKNNKSGITGVFWRERDQRWICDIKISGKKTYLGSFKSKTDAVRARWNAEVKHGFPNCNTTRFSVSSEAVFKDIEGLAGGGIKVMVKYNAWLIMPCRMGDTNYNITSIETVLVDKQ